MVADHNGTYPRTMHRFALSQRAVGSFKGFKAIVLLCATVTTACCMQSLDGIAMHGGHK